MSEDMLKIPVFTKALMPLPATAVCVIIPVRNEAEGLWQTLEALRLQTDGSGQLLDSNLFEVLVLINNTKDESLKIAKAYQKTYPAFNLHVDKISLSAKLAHIGTVRKLLMDKAFERLMYNSHFKGIIVSTDGDTVVNCNWIWEIKKAMQAGAEAVGGRIITPPNEDSSRLYHLRDVTYRCLLAKAEALIDPVSYDPYPRHFQFFGANMAVNCQVYKLAGGLPHVPCLEDMAFYNALVLKDVRIRKSFDVKVCTSFRQDGRVEVGFSEQLKKWGQEKCDGIVQLVQDVEQALAVFKLRADLRYIWVNRSKVLFDDDIELIAKSTAINKEWLCNLILDTDYFGELWHQVEQSTHIEEKHQPIISAISQLRCFINDRINHAKPSPTSQADNSRYVAAVNA